MKVPSYVVNPGNNEDKTVVVMGAFRGGTTMVAAAVHSLGVPMRQREPTPDEVNDYDNWEDREMQKLLWNAGKLLPVLSPDRYPAAIAMDKARKEMNAKLPELLQIIDRRRELGTWGWKFPFTALWLLETPLLQKLTNPHLIVVFRDPLAIWQHECDTKWCLPHEFQKHGTKPSFIYACTQLQFMERLVQQTTAPLMVVSFERASKSQESKTLLLRELQQFLHLHANDEQIDQAIKNMMPPAKPVA